MIKYIKDPKSDMHGDMAKQIFCLDDFDTKDPSMEILRYAAKNCFVFPQFYGDYYGNNIIGLSKWSKLRGKYKEDMGIQFEDGTFLGDHLIRNGIKNSSHFEHHLKEIQRHFWRERFPVYNEWKESWWKAYQNVGYFYMKTGFRCSGVMGRNDVINYPVQGSAFHCLLWSFIELDRIIQEERLNTRLIAQIHDSIILDVDPSELKYILKLVRRVTCKDLLKAWDWIIVPLDIEAELCAVDRSWYHKEEVKI